MDPVDDKNASVNGADNKEPSEENNALKAAPVEPSLCDESFSSNLVAFRLQMTDTTESFSPSLAARFRAMKELLTYPDFDVEQDKVAFQLAAHIIEFYDISGREHSELNEEPVIGVKKSIDMLLEKGCEKEKIVEALNKDYLIDMIAKRTPISVGFSFPSHTGFYDMEGALMTNQLRYLGMNDESIKKLVNHPNTIDSIKSGLNIALDENDGTLELLIGDILNYYHNDGLELEKIGYDEATLKGLLEGEILDASEEDFD